MSEELKPCPFCGGKAIIVSYGSDDNGSHQIDCDNEKCCSPSSNTHRIKTDAISAWNTRTPDTSAVELALGYHKFADAVEHDLAVPLYLRGLAGVAKTKADEWLKKWGV